MTQHSTPDSDFQTSSPSGIDLQSNSSFQKDDRQQKKTGSPVFSMRPSRVQELALTAMLAALAFALSFLESLIPFQPGLPGVKPGFANLVIVFALCRMNARSALGINLVRILLSGLLFSGLFGILYSIAGAAASLAAMAGLLAVEKKRECRGRKPLFSIFGISMTGGVFHNLGQLLVAIFLLSSLNLVYYLPVMILSGIVTGLINGMIAEVLLEKLPHQFFTEKR